MPVVHLGSTYVGNSTSTAHQIWSGGKSGKFGFEYRNIKFDQKAPEYNQPLWTWSGFELDGTPNSVKFTPDPIDGGLQGDFSYGIGSPNSAYPQAVSTYNQTKQIMEVDPAGGILEFSMVARELSYWHKIGPVLRISNTSQLGNQMNIKEFRTYFLDNKSQYDIQKVPYNTDVQSLWYTTSTNTYSYEYVFDVLKSDTATTWQPSKTNKKDLTFTCYVGPNNTPYSAYTYIGLLGFANEVNNLEYNNTSAVHPYAKGEVPGVTMNVDNPPVGRPVHTNIYTDSTGNNHYMDWRVGDDSVATGIDNQRLICFWQKPNVLYYVHMLWVTPLHTDYNTAPTQSELLTTWTTDWDITDYDLLLYVEFGISPNGGHDIFWNNATTTGTLGDTIQKVYARNISATVPQDIYKYIHPTIEATSVNRQSVTPYTVTSTKTETNNQPFKFVRIRVHLSSKNDEHNNLSKNRYQKYAVLNYEQVEALSPGNSSMTTESTLDPNNNGIHYAKYDYTPYAGTRFNFQIGRKYKTNDWNLQTSATLYYESGSMRYEGETTIHQ